VKGRQKGRPTKWVYATVNQSVELGKSGVTFEVWSKWRKQGKKLGTLMVSVGGLSWWQHSGKVGRQRNWEKVAGWFDKPS